VKRQNPLVAIHYYADIVIKKAFSIGDLKDPTFAVEGSICPQHAVCIGCFSGPGPLILPYFSDADAVLGLEGADYELRRSRTLLVAQ
jgi:hypothetical protein